MAANSPNQSPLRFILTLLFVVVLPLGVGLYAAPRVVPEPKIGILRLNYDIFSDTAFLFTEQLAYAREDDSIKAVVIVINSPGGSAAFSEELYLDVLHTREQMPVVASIDLLAASGAYYTAAAADEIYAKPTSAVGSIGVIAFLPGEVFIEEDVLTTGPYKAFGGTRDGTVRQIERAKFAFLEAVKAGRGDRLQITDEVLSRAEIYTGVQALEFGLIDGLMSNDEVIARAAELAGLNDYEVVELFPLVFGEENTPFVSYNPPPIDQERLWATPTDLPPGLYYRLIVPSSP
ncbi:MAG: S49 family peptidase [Chloroflexi bacterium]|nr:MAG: S49 family peptidase [Chloroflexota bacterium]